MKIQFVKDHVNYAQGEVVENHPNEQYLLILGVATEVKEIEEPKKKGKKKDGI
jgi:hypothetical protein